MPTAFSTFSIFDPEDFLSSRTSENGQSPSSSRAYLHSTWKFRRVTVLKYGNVCRKVRLIAFGNSCAPEEIYAAVVNAAERKGCCVRGLEINEEKGFVSRACSAYANQEATQTSPELISPLFFLRSIIHAASRTFGITRRVSLKFSADPKLIPTCSDECSPFQ